MSKESNLTRVKKALIKSPNITADVIASQVGVSKVYAYNLLSNARKKLGMNKQRDGTWKFKIRLQGSRPESFETVSVTTSGQSILAGGPTEAELNATDNINPAHYKVGGIETIDYIKAKLTPEEFIGYLKGNVIKYTSRAGKKQDMIQDLEKGQWYMNRQIKELKGEVK
jgi:hypothetical protein